MSRSNFQDQLMYASRLRTLPMTKQLPYYDPISPMKKWLWVCIAYHSHIDKRHLISEVFEKMVKSTAVVGLPILILLQWWTVACSETLKIWDVAGFARHSRLFYTIQIWMRTEIFKKCDFVHLNRLLGLFDAAKFTCEGLGSLSRRVGAEANYFLFFKLVEQNSEIYSSGRVTVRARLNLFGWKK